MWNSQPYYCRLVGEICVLEEEEKNLIPFAGRISSREGKSRKWRERATSTSKGSYFSTWRPVCLYFHSYPIVLHGDTNFSLINQRIGEANDRSSTFCNLSLFWKIYTIQHILNYPSLGMILTIISSRNPKDLVVRSTNVKWYAIYSMYRLNREKGGEKSMT